MKRDWPEFIRIALTVLFCSLSGGGLYWLLSNEGFIDDNRFYFEGFFIFLGGFLFLGLPWHVFLKRRTDITRSHYVWFGIVAGMIYAAFLWPVMAYMDTTLHDILTWNDEKSLSLTVISVLGGMLIYGVLGCTAGFMCSYYFYSAVVVKKMDRLAHSVSAFFMVGFILTVFHILLIPFYF